MEDEDEDEEVAVAVVLVREVLVLKVVEGKRSVPGGVLGVAIVASAERGCRN